MPLVYLNIVTALETEAQLCASMQEVLERHDVVSYESIRIHTAASENETSETLLVELVG